MQIWPKITTYFKTKMYGAPDPRVLQQVMLFYTNVKCTYVDQAERIYVKMQVNTFAMAIDGEISHRYIYQRVDEADKDHSAHDTNFANQGRIYEVKGTYNLKNMHVLKFSDKPNEI